MHLARTERTALCDLLDEVGPDAPTLCEGWTTHDLAAHLWVREADPLGAPGIIAKPLAGVTDRRMTQTKQRWTYPELVERIRNGPFRLSVFAIPGVDEAANAVEFFVHHEDVRRLNGHPDARELGSEVEDWLWRRLALLARAWFHKAPVGVVLERSDVAHSALRGASGEQTVTLLGTPSELLLYANGRHSAAHVRLIGTEETIATFTAATD